MFVPTSLVSSLARAARPVSRANTLHPTGGKMQATMLPLQWRKQRVWNLSPKRSNTSPRHKTLTCSHDVSCNPDVPTNSETGAERFAATGRRPDAASQRPDDRPHDLSRTQRRRGLAVAWTQTASPEGPFPRAAWMATPTDLERKKGALTRGHRHQRSRSVASDRRSFVPNDQQQQRIF